MGALALCRSSTSGRQQQVVTGKPFASCVKQSLYARDKNCGEAMICGTTTGFRNVGDSKECTSRAMHRAACDIGCRSACQVHRTGNGRGKLGCTWTCTSLGSCESRM